MRAFLGAVLSVTAMVAASLATGAVAADRLETIKARGKVLVGTGSTNPPWHFRDDAGNLAGFDVDMAKIVAKGLFDDPERSSSSSRRRMRGCPTWSPTRSTSPASS